MRLNYLIKLSSLNINIKNDLNFVKRPFWYWLNHAWNQYDTKRVDEVGPNRACAEWLLKCGAHVKFSNWGTYVVDYNKLPGGSFEQYQIEEIRAENACIMARGMEYLNGLKKVKRIKLISCELIDDAALAKLAYTRNSLEELQLVFLPNVTDFGLSYLYLLTNLKDLYINYMPNVKDPKLAVKLLKEKLPDCKIEFIEGQVEDKKPNDKSK